MGESDQQLAQLIADGKVLHEGCQQLGQNSE
jgi:hypothetical protein